MSEEDLFDRLPLFQGMSTVQKKFLRPLFILCQEAADEVVFEQGAEVGGNPFALVLHQVERPDHDQ